MKNSKLLVVRGSWLVVLAAVLVTGAAMLANGYRVEDASDSVRPVARIPETSPAVLSATVASNKVFHSVALSPRGTKAVRITSETTITPAVRQMLADMGARIIAPVGSRAVVAEVSPAVMRTIHAQAGFSVADVSGNAKIQPRLATRCANATEDVIPVTVVGLAEEDVARVRAWILAQGGTLNEGPASVTSLRASVSPALVAELATRGDVRWIEYAPPLKLLNDLSAQDGASNVDSVRAQHKLRGAGQIVTIYDSGFDTGSVTSHHLDFGSRVVNILNCGGYTKADFMGHGTHCAGTILGDGSRSSGQYKGAAPRAQLFVQGGGDTQGSTSIYFGNCHSYADVFARGYLDAQSYVQSDSWGGDTAGAYDAFCNGLDEVAWTYPELLIVVACGNDGEHGDQTVGSPASAKNALTVGNAQSTRSTSTNWGLPASPENLNPSSSRGPTEDGRFKPDLVAPGTEVISTLSSKSVRCDPISTNPYYTKMTGTSMATPLVAGSAALVREWLLDRRNYAAKHEGRQPTAALVKAILTGGGVVMTGQGANYGDLGSAFALNQNLPNGQVGWGRINLEQTLYPTGRAVKFFDRVPFANGNEEVYDVETTDEADFDVQLVWTDYPADISTSSTGTLVNDLDLIVSNKTTGVVWYGNGVAGGDRTNTVESVRVSALPAGDYAVIVRGTSVSYDSTQGGAAAVYVRGAFEDETAPDPLYVRNARTGVSYECLDDAIDSVLDGDVLEICCPVELRTSLTITNAITIVATNVDAAASAVTRIDDAALTIASGAKLTLSNVVFEASGATLLDVKAGGRVKLCDGVDLGVGYDDGVAIKTADADGFELAGVLGQSLLLQCAVATEAPQAFGMYTCAQSVAEASAQKIVCADDATRESRGFAKDGSLSWKVTQVPVEDSAGWYVTYEDGKFTTNAYVQLDRVFEQYALMSSNALPRITIRKSGTLSVVTTVTNVMEVVGEGDVVVTPEGTASFRIVTGGDLTFSNIVFYGYSDADADDAYGFIAIEGGTLTLESGAELDSMTGCVYGGSGVVDVNYGTMTMKSGSAIVNCRADGMYGMGGAINLLGADCTLNLQGGAITNCSAAYGVACGGGIYVGNWEGDPIVNLSGDLTVDGNCSDKVSVDNICLASYDLLSNFKVTGVLYGGYIGVRYEGDEGNAEGEAFITYANGMSEFERMYSAAHFFSYDDDGNFLYGVDGDDGTFVWKMYVDDGQCEFWDAIAIVTEYDGNWNSVGNRYYASLMTAIAHLTPGTTNRIDVTGSFTGGTSCTLSGDNTIPQGCVVCIASYPAQSFRILRSKSARIEIPSGTSLTLMDVVIDRKEKNPGNVTNALFDVNGGVLELDRGICISNILGNSSRDACAVCVHNDGWFAMRDGSQIAQCQNCYNYKLDLETTDKNWGCGGGVLVDHSYACLYGGEITRCVATSGGGVYACNEAEVYVAGGMRIADNKWQNTNGVQQTSNVYIADDAGMCLDGELTGRIGAGTEERITRDTNLVATVWSDYDWTNDVESLSSSATNFVHDVTGERGVAVTNDEALIVWSSALMTDPDTGVRYYVDGDGNWYFATAETPQPGPTPVAVEPIAFKSITRVSDVEWALVITNRVSYCGYRLLWTENLSQGFTATGAWETATADGEWTTNVLFSAPAPTAVFWKAEGKDGEKPAE